MANKLPPWMSNMKVGQAFRMITTCFATLILGYNMAQPFVEAWAGEAFVNALEQAGVAPKDFAEMKRQGVDNGKDIDKVSADTEKIKEKLISVTGEVKALNKSLEDTTKSIENVEGLVQKLLEIQLNKRADMSFSPPGTGPAGVPQLGALR